MKTITIIIIIIFITVILPQAALAATLSLSPASGTFNRNCDFSLTIDLDTTGTQTDGTDAILRYDSSRFTAKNIVSGTIYPDYPGNNICENNALCPGAGKITVSGLAAVSTPFSGKGSLATINFTVLPNAQNTATAITFDFDPNDKTKTTDSNVVERGTVADVLSSVINGNYTIGTGTACTQGSTGTGTGTGTGIGTGTSLVGQGGAGGTPSAQQISTKALPPAGSEQLTFAITIVGATLVILGILGLALL